MSKLLWVAALALGIALAPSVRAADEKPVNLVKNGDAETGTLDNWSGFTKVITDNPHGGKSCFLGQGQVMVQSNEFIPIDPNKSYTMTAWVKSTGKETSVFYAGLIPCDADKNPIEHTLVDAIAATDTVMTEACTAADKVIKVTDASTWKTLDFGCVAFAVDDSGHYKDLPNRNLSTYGVVACVNKGKYWEVQLKEACGKAYPAGTKVREQTSGGTYIYAAASGIGAGPQWAQITGTVKGSAICGAPNDQWWAGTKYARVLFLLSYGQGDAYGMAVDDVCVTESAK